jgi:CRP-like cAMP-binding protein
MPAPGIVALPSGLKSRFLGGLSPRDLEILRAAARERRYLANSIITNQGNPAEYFYLLTSGRARHFFLTQDGRKTLLLWLTPGDVFGVATMLLESSKYLISTEAIKDSSFLTWDRATLRRLTAQHPGILENALLVACDYLTWYVADHVALVRHSARQRLAQVLVCLSEVIGRQISDGIEIDATNEELASAANITPFTASRLLSEWQTARAIAKRRGKIVLRSPERLFLCVVKSR